MKLSVAWLEELVELALSPDALAERLTMAGLEVEGIDRVGALPRVVAGTIVETAPHPSADRLSVCRVDAGGGELLTVVSGAPNLAVGASVATALPGARLEKGGEVRAVELRGVRSEAVVASEAELGLSEEGGGVLELPKGTDPGAPVDVVLATEDAILEISITPNRGDCLSVLGIAREIATLTGARLRPLARPARLRSRGGKTVEVEIRDADLCPRYTGRILEGARLGPSPFWMRRRLEASGVRAINNVVDVTNYVMLERGQPLHAFDLREIHGRRIVVRRAAKRERFETLDGVVRDLEEGDLVIADAKRAVALAGIMGGEGSAIRDDTRDLLLESAFFAPEGIRRTSRRLGLRSESSYRFERMVDPNGAIAASDRAASLLAELTGATLHRIADAHPRRRRAHRVTVRHDRVNHLLGTSLTAARVRQALERVSARMEAKGRGRSLCEAPSWRADLEREVDFVEEVARVIGYEAIPPTLPRLPVVAAEVSPARRTVLRAREILVGEGFFEVVGFRFGPAEANRRFEGLSPTDARPIPLRNPVSSEMGEMRRSLVPGLLAAAVRNRNHGEPWIRAFEIGPVFWRRPDIPNAQGARLGGILRGVRPRLGVGSRGAAESFDDAKGTLEALLDGLRVEGARFRAGGAGPWLHPGKSATIELNGASLGVIGGLHPEAARAADLEGDTWVFEVDLDLLTERTGPLVAVQPVPRHPAVTRDLALVAEEALEVGRLLEAAEARKDLLVDQVRLFDVYRGDPVPPGKKSLAFSIAYQAPDRTLTDEEVSRAHEELIRFLGEGFGVVPRA